MSSAPINEIRAMLRHEVEAIRGRWIWLVTLGILLVVFGVLAIAVPWIAGIQVAVVLGVLMMAGGIAEGVGAFWTRNWSGFFSTLLAGILYFVVGLVFVMKPGAALAALTMLIASFLLVAGGFRIVAAIMYRFAQWGWVLLSGVITLLMGLLILMDWPASSLWVIGTFLGIEMIMHGWSWVMLGLALRRLPKAS